MDAPSHVLKLERAREHLEALKLEADTWINGKPYSIVDESNPNPRNDKPGYLLCVQRRFRVEHVAGVPGKLSVMIGDVVFNARSALDHLALALALAHTTNMNEGQIRDSEFPIFDSPIDSRTERKKIGCMAPEVRDIVKSLQPYHAADGSGEHPLWLLHRINCIDKHRILTACTISPERGSEGPYGLKHGFRFSNWIRDLQGMFWIATPTELVNDAVILQYGIMADLDANIAMEPDFPIEIAFGEESPAPLKSAIPLLDSILDFVRDSVITPLAKFL
jgi:hypothetical protein